LHSYASRYRIATAIQCAQVCLDPDQQRRRDAVLEVQRLAHTFAEQF
jgi:hypothetical protein